MLVDPDMAPVQIWNLSTRAKDRGSWSGSFLHSPATSTNSEVFGHVGFAIERSWGLADRFWLAQNLIPNNAVFFMVFIKESPWGRWLDPLR